VGGWIAAVAPQLPLHLSGPIREALGEWLQSYGELNGIVGLETGPLERRFNLLRRHLDSTRVLVYMTPEYWAKRGPHVQVQVREMGLELEGMLDRDRFLLDGVALIDESGPAPRDKNGSIGVELEVGLVLLPQADDAPGLPVAITNHLREQKSAWTSALAPLERLLEAETQQEQEREAAVRGTYSEATREAAPDRNVWQLAGVPPAIAGALATGEWLELSDRHDRDLTLTRVLEADASGVLRVDLGDGGTPPASGKLRLRPRRKLLVQKHAILRELTQPTGRLPHLVRLVAAPSARRAITPQHPRRFVNPDVGRNASQARAVGLALGLDEGDALLVHGPPGTGKSTTAAEIIAQLLVRDPAARILVCSHSNHGTDNLLARVLPFIESPTERIARVGFLDRVARASRPYFAASDADLSDRSVILATVDALALQDVAGARLYDYVILDEANRAPILDSLLALARGTRVLLVGDPKQLQPVGGNEQSLFAWLLERGFPEGAQTLLDEQNRMHPAIGALISSVFYDGRVSNGPNVPREPIATDVITSPVTWVDTRALGPEAQLDGSHSLENESEALAVTALLESLVSQTPPSASIAVITTYAAQRRRLRALIGTPVWAAERQLQIDTVDAFEGRERDIVLVSLVRSNLEQQTGFVQIASRLNVALSRARRMLVIFGDTSTLRGPVFERLLEHVQALPGAMLPAARLSDR
jgi:hypothetical protein